MSRQKYTKIMGKKDDYIVKNVPVYLSKSLAEELYIAFYPTYDNDNIYEDVILSKVSIKPQNQEFRTEFSLDIENTEAFDYERAKEIAFNAMNKSKETENEEMFSSGLMDKIVFASEAGLQNNLNYAVGIFQDGELHITPLKNLFHMKVRCDYLDESDKRAKEGMKNLEEEDEDIAPVKVTFSKHVPENIKKKQEQSFRYHTKKTQEEHWIHTNYISFNDSQAELTRMQMFCSSPEVLNALNLEPIRYIQALFQIIQPQAKSSSQNVPENKMDLHQIWTLPLLDQVRILMKRVQIISFTTLRRLISSKHDSTTILKYLQQVAVLVQGNWIVNSDLVYPKDVQDGISELMCKARDYILLLFTEQTVVKRNELSNVIKLKLHEIDEIFAGFAKHVPSRGWQLKQLPNQDFCNSYPEITQRQEVFWDTKRKHLREMLETQNQPLQRQRRKSHRDSIGSENEEKNVGHGRKSLRDSSLSDNDSTTEPVKQKKGNRSKKGSKTK